MLDLELLPWYLNSLFIVIRSFVHLKRRMEFVNVHLLVTKLIKSDFTQFYCTFDKLNFLQYKLEIASRYLTNLTTKTDINLFPSFTHFLQIKICICFIASVLWNFSQKTFNQILGSYLQTQWSYIKFILFVDN